MQIGQRRDGEEQIKIRLLRPSENPSTGFLVQYYMRSNSLPSQGAFCWQVINRERVFALRMNQVLLIAVFAFCIAALAGPGHAQQPSGSSSSQAGSLPDAPQTVQTNPSPSDQERLPQTKRILGIIPNFRAVSTDEKLPRQTFKEKFMDATADSFDYSSVLIPAVIAGHSMATNADPEFHQGAAGYARYFWHAAVDQTSENYMVEFIGPVLTREDSRYYTLGRGGFFKRTGYALSRAAITRTDAGNESFNISEVVGAGASAGLSSLYYPSRERSFGNTASQWGLDVGIDAASFMAREFWPDINRSLFHGKGGGPEAGANRVTDR
jgi:hypothetical protein